MKAQKITKIVMVTTDFVTLEPDLWFESTAFFVELSIFFLVTDKSGLDFEDEPS